MKKLRVAIIGQGRSGRDIHGEFYKRDVSKDRYEVVAVVDAIDHRRARAAEEYGCDVYASYQELFARDDIDLVINSTISHQHKDITIDLLNHGFNVVCEKPVCRTVEELDEMIAAAKKNGKYFNVFQQSRLAPYFLKIKEILASGNLGEIYEVDIQFNGFARRWDWQTLQCCNGGNLYNTGPHPLDQALNILNDYDNMPNVFCKMARAHTFGDAEDYVKLILTAPGKPLIDLSISSCDAYPLFTYKIHGSRGGLMGGMGAFDWKYYKDEEAPEQKLIREPLEKEEGLPAYCGEKLPFVEEHFESDPSSPFIDAVDNYYAMTYDAIVNGVEPEITPYQVRQQIAVIEECHRQNPFDRLPGYEK